MEKAAEGLPLVTRLRISPQPRRQHHYRSMQQNDLLTRLRAHTRTAHRALKRDLDLLAVIPDRLLARFLCGADALA